MVYHNIAILKICTLLLILTLACGISFDGLLGQSAAEQTLQAIYVQQTVEALEQIVEPEPEEQPETQPTEEIIHNITPGSPSWVSQYWNDTHSKSTANQKRAPGGDFLNQNLLERPFTANDMLYRPDVDLVKVEISQDATFYYFFLHLSGVHPDINMLSAHYGVEIDLNRDGRGNILLWAKGDGNQEWNIDQVFVYRDSNEDVGGRRPLQADAPGYTGDSYDQLLFSPDHLDDPDAAWKRVDPTDPTIMQLAIKKSLLGNATSFMWNGWADDGVSDPEKFDYNDFFTLAEAGSPISGANDYPLKALYLVDNTCRLAFGFEPTGNEPGVCFVAQPTPEPTPRPTARPTNTTEPPPCNCSDFPNYTFINDEACCLYCGYNWTGNVEFPCDLP